MANGINRFVTFHDPKLVAALQHLGDGSHRDPHVNIIIHDYVLGEDEYTNNARVTFGDNIILDGPGEATISFDENEDRELIFSMTSGISEDETKGYKCGVYFLTKITFSGGYSLTYPLLYLPELCKEEDINWEKIESEYETEEEYDAKSAEFPISYDLLYGAKIEFFPTFYKLNTIECVLYSQSDNYGLCNNISSTEVNSGSLISFAEAERKSADEESAYLGIHYTPINSKIPRVATIYNVDDMDNPLWEYAKNALYLSEEEYSVVMILLEAEIELWQSGVSLFSSDELLDVVETHFNSQVREGTITTEAAERKKKMATKLLNDENISFAPIDQIIITLMDIIISERMDGKSDEQIYSDLLEIAEQNIQNKSMTAEETEQYLLVAQKILNNDFSFNEIFSTKKELVDNEIHLLLGGNSEIPNDGKDWAKIETANLPKANYLFIQARCAYEENNETSETEETDEDTDYNNEKVSAPCKIYIGNTVETTGVGECAIALDNKGMDTEDQSATVYEGETHTAYAIPTDKHNFVKWSKWEQVEGEWVNTDISRKKKLSFKTDAEFTGDENYYYSAYFAEKNPKILHCIIETQDIPGGTIQIGSTTIPSISATTGYEFDMNLEDTIRWYSSGVTYDVIKFYTDKDCTKVAKCIRTYDEATKAYRYYSGIRTGASQEYAPDFPISGTIVNDAPGEEISRGATLYVKWIDSRTIPKTPSINQYEVGSTSINGTCETIGATIVARINGSETYTGTVDSSGDWNIDLTDTVKEGDKAVVFASKNGKDSAETTMTATSQWKPADPTIEAYILESQDDPVPGNNIIITFNDETIQSNLETKIYAAMYDASGTERASNEYTLPDRTTGSVKFANVVGAGWKVVAQARLYKSSELYRSSNLIEQTAIVRKPEVTKELTASSPYTEGTCWYPGTTIKAAYISRDGSEIIETSTTSSTEKDENGCYAWSMDDYEGIVKMGDVIQYWVDYGTETDSSALETLIQEPSPLDYVTGITVLSADETLNLLSGGKRFEYRKCLYKGEPCPWWLRDPGHYENFAAFVEENGTIREWGRPVNGEMLGENTCVRPALTLSNIESSGISEGDTFKFHGYTFTVISNEYALCDEAIANIMFRMDSEAEDANVYEKSDIKKFLDDWYEGVFMKDYIDDITLLSRDELWDLLTHEQCMCNYKGEPCEWWLRTPAKDTPFDYVRNVMYVRTDGIVQPEGVRVDTTEKAVRPVLKLSNFGSSRLAIGDTFEFGGYSFTIISDKYALCNEAIAMHMFREQYDVEEASVYEESDVKIYLDNWFNGVFMKDYINGITLWSVSEATNLLTEKQKRREYEGEPVTWWLRTPGPVYYPLWQKHAKTAAIVGRLGVVDTRGLSVNSNRVYVCPALILSNFKSDDEFGIGDTFDFGGYVFKIITDEYALCTEVIGKCPFRIDEEEDDSFEYDKSDVKVYICNWYRDVLGVKPEANALGVESETVSLTVRTSTPVVEESYLLTEKLSDNITNIKVSWSDETLPSNCKARLDIRTYHSNGTLKDYFYEETTNKTLTISKYSALDTTDYVTSQVVIFEQDGMEWKEWLTSNEIKANSVVYKPVIQHFVSTSDPYTSGYSWYPNVSIYATYYDVSTGLSTGATATSDSEKTDNFYNWIFRDYPYEDISIEDYVDYCTIYDESLYSEIVTSNVRPADPAVLYAWYYPASDPKLIAAWPDFKNLKTTWSDESLPDGYSYVMHIERHDTEYKPEAPSVVWTASFTEKSYTYEDRTWFDFKYKRTKINGMRVYCWVAVYDGDELIAKTNSVGKMISFQAPQIEKDFTLTSPYTVAYSMYPCCGGYGFSAYAKLYDRSGTFLEYAFCQSEEEPVENKGYKLTFKEATSKIEYGYQVEYYIEGTSYGNQFSDRTWATVELEDPVIDESYLLTEQWKTGYGKNIKVTQPAPDDISGYGYIIKVNVLDEYGRVQGSQTSDLLTSAPFEFSCFISMSLDQTATAQTYLYKTNKNGSLSDIELLAESNIVSKAPIIRPPILYFEEGWPVPHHRGFIWYWGRHMDLKLYTDETTVLAQDEVWASQYPHPEDGYYFYREWSELFYDPDNPITMDDIYKVGAILQLDDTHFSDEGILYNPGYKPKK